MQRKPPSPPHGGRPSAPHTARPWHHGPVRPATTITVLVLLLILAVASVVFTIQLVAA